MFRNISGEEMDRLFWDNDSGFEIFEVDLDGTELLKSRNCLCRYYFMMQKTPDRYSDRIFAFYAVNEHGIVTGRVIFNARSKYAKNSAA